LENEEKNHKRTYRSQQKIKIFRSIGVNYEKIQ